MNTTMKADSTAYLISYAATLRDAYTANPSLYYATEFAKVADELRARGVLAVMPGYPDPRIDSPQ